MNVEANDESNSQNELKAEQKMKLESMYKFGSEQKFRFWFHGSVRSVCLKFIGCGFKVHSGQLFHSYFYL